MQPDKGWHAAESSKNSEIGWQHLGREQRLSQYISPAPVIQLKSINLQLTERLLSVLCYSAFCFSGKYADVLWQSSKRLLFSFAS